jgi:RNA polymerase sigma-70 factor, ECF subfamily
MNETLTGQEEAEQIRRAKEGDGDAFEALFHAYYPMTFALAYRLIGCHHDAEEIVQDAFIKAARALPHFRGDSSLKTWLYRIAVNVAADRRRRRKDTVELRDEIAPAQSTSEDHPLTEALLVALDTLSSQQRQAIVLTYFEGMNHAEAAAVLRCAETTVSWRVFSAKRKLKKILSRSATLREGVPVWTTKS